jgi:hypothetical protein
MGNRHTGFDFTTVKLMRQVLDEAWDKLSVIQQTKTTKSEMAQGIILHLADKGERDPVRLRTLAVTSAIMRAERRDARGRE